MSCSEIPNSWNYEYHLLIKTIGIFNTEQNYFYKNAYNDIGIQFDIFIKIQYIIVAFERV